MGSRLRVAVVTPYCTESAQELERCHRSVQSQAGVDATHVLVGDGPDVAELRFDNAICTRLPVAAHDFGETPRLAGWQIAMDRAFEAVAYLDADNWFYPGHLHSLASAAARANAEIAVSNRILHHLNGDAMARCLQSDGIEFSDTNCMMFMLPAAARWRDVVAAIEPPLKPVHDRVLWCAIIRSGARVARTGQFSVAYLSKVAGHYRSLGLPVPDGVEGRGKRVQEAAQLWAARGNVPFRLDARVAPL
ncbi:MAG: glycosyltransferase [Sphingomonas sp.]